MQGILLTTLPSNPSSKGSRLLHFQKPKFFKCISSSNPSTLNSKSRSHSDCPSLKFDFTSGISARAFLKWMSSCLSCIPSRLASWSIPVYVVAFSLVANAHDNTLVSVSYPCEDIQSYYTGTDGLEGEALSRKLNSIIAGHHSLSYKEVWVALENLDAAEVDEPEASGGIVEIYSARIVPKNLAGKPEGWNREHLWPRSYGLMNAPSLTDLHNIRPADVNVNSARGNKYFGECHVGLNRCKMPANKEAAPDTETDVKIWAPPLQVRGDVARSLMYMAVRYGFHRAGEGPSLHLSDSPSMANREMGLLSVLMKWNELDPPSREEKLRNEKICKLYQHNRNPFIDHPEYARRIWKQAISDHQSASRVQSDEFLIPFQRWSSKLGACLRVSEE